MSNLKKASSSSSSNYAPSKPQATRVKSSTSSALIQRELLKNQKFGGQDENEDEEDDYTAIRPKAPQRYQSSSSKQTNAIVEKTSTQSRASVRRFDAFGFVKCIKIAYTSAPLDGPSPQRSSRYGGGNKRLDDNSDDDDDDVDIQYSLSSRRAKAGSVATTPRRTAVTNTASSQPVVDDYQWFNVSVPSVDASANVKVRFTNGNISLNDLAGFNNTGNVCLWPSEEIMTYFCVKNSGIFDDKCVCELGGGMTCLGGLMISKCSQPKEVFLTDGNESSFENLEVICNENEFQCSVECCLLQWSKETNYGDLEERFDYIICADCLFFDEFREDLCVTIYKLLKNEGTCLIFAPNRQNTFHKFVDMAKLHFECMIVHDYDMEVWDKHLYEKEHNPDYEEDIHYPLLLKLKKRQTRNANDFCKMVL